MKQSEQSDIRTMSACWIMGALANAYRSKGDLRSPQVIAAEAVDHANALLAELIDNENAILSDGMDDAVPDHVV